MSGQKIRALTVIDIFTHECLAIEVGYRLRGENVAEVLNCLVRLRGAPKALFTDNGAEFTANAVLAWAQERTLDWYTIVPGKPTQNAFCEARAAASGTNA